MKKYYIISFFFIIGHNDSYSFDLSILLVPIVYTSYSIFNYFWGDNKYNKECINIPMSLKEKYISSVDCYLGKNFFDRAKIFNLYQDYACLKKATIVPFFGSMIVPYTINKISGKDGVSDVFMGLFIQFVTTLLVESILCNMNNFSVEKSVDEFRSNTSIKSKLFVSSFFKKYVMTYIRALYSNEILEKNKDLYEMKGVYFNFIDMEEMIGKNSNEINSYTSIIYRYMNTIYDKYLHSSIVDNQLGSIVCSMRSLSYKISKISLLCKNIDNLLQENDNYIEYDKKLLFSIHPINVFLSNDDFLLGLSAANEYSDSVIFALAQKEEKLSSFIKQVQFIDYKKVIDLYNNYKQILSKKNFIIDNCFEKKNKLLSWFDSEYVIQAKKRNFEDDIKTIESIKYLLNNIFVIEQDIKVNQKSYYDLRSNWYFKTIAYDPVAFVNIYNYSLDELNSYIDLLKCKNNKILSSIKFINLAKEQFNFVYPEGEKLRVMFHDIPNFSSFVEFANKEKFEQSMKNFNDRNEKYRVDSDFIILARKKDLEEEYKNRDELFFKRLIAVLTDFKIIENAYINKKKAFYDFKNYIMQYQNNIFFDIIFKNYTVSESYKNYSEYFSFLNEEISGNIDITLYKEKKEILLEEEKKQVSYIQNNNKECKKIASLVIFENTCLLNNPLHFSEAQLNYIITDYKNLLYQNNFYIKDNLELIFQKDINLNQYLQKIDISNFQEHIQVLSQYHKEFLFFDEWYQEFLKKNANKMKLFESHVYESEKLYYKKIQSDCENYYRQISSYNLDNFFSLMTKKNKSIKDAIIEIKDKKNDFIKRERMILKQSIIYRKQFLKNLLHDTEKLFSDEKKAQYGELINKINALLNLYNEKLANNEDKISELDGNINKLIQELRSASFI